MFAAVVVAALPAQAAGDCNGSTTDQSAQHYRCVDLGTPGTNPQVPTSYWPTDMTGASNVVGTGDTSGGTGGATACNGGSSCLGYQDPNATGVPEYGEYSTSCVAVGFTFQYYGANYNCVWVNADGFVVPDNAPGAKQPVLTGHEGSPRALPEKSIHAGKIAGFWANLDASWGTQCTSAVESKAMPSVAGSPRNFTIAWIRVLHADDGDSTPKCNDGSTCPSTLESFQIRIQEHKPGQAQSDVIEAIEQTATTDFSAHFNDKAAGCGPPSAGGETPVAADPAAIGIDEAANGTQHGLNYTARTPVTQLANVIRFYPNHGPAFTAASLSKSVNEDTSSALTASDLAATDPDGDAVVGYCLAAPAAHGAFSPALPACSGSAEGSSVTYVPQHDFCGTDTYQLSAVDSYDPGAAIRVTVTVACVNDPPTMTPLGTLTMLEDKSLTVNVTGITDGGSGNDTGDWPVSISVTSGNPNIVATLSSTSVASATATPPTLTLRPATGVRDWNSLIGGTVPLTFKLVDSGSNVAPNNNTALYGASLTVQWVNDAPLFTAGPTVSASSTDGAQTRVGWATGMAPGPSTATDEAGQKLRFTVTAARPALFSAGPSVTPSTFTAGPWQNMGDLSFTPAGGTCGNSTLTVTLQDDNKTANGGVDSTSSTVSVSIACRPFANTDDYSVFSDAVLKVAAPGVLANDQIGDNSSLTAKLLSGPSHAASGAFTFNANGSFSYAPAASFPSGTDSFTYAAVSSTGFQSPAATVTIHVLKVYYHPYDDSYTVAEESPLSTAGTQPSASCGPTDGVLCNDQSNVGALTASVNTPPAHAKAGSFSLSPNGAFTYQGADEYFGSDLFTYNVTDSSGHPARTATVHLTVAWVNDPPVAKNFTTYSVYVSSTVGGKRSLTLQATDPDARPTPLSYCILAAPSIGTLTTSPPACGTGMGPAAVTYKAVANSYAPDSFTYRAYDGASWSGVGTVNLTMTSTDHRPHADPQPRTGVPMPTTNENTSVAILLTGSDPDNDSLTFQVVAPPVRGIVTGTPPLVLYTPNKDYCNDPGGSPDAFTFNADDGTGSANATSGTATVHVDVKCIDQHPMFTPATTVVQTQVNFPPTVVTGWASSITTGPSNEASQKIRFQTSYTNPSLFLPGGVAPYVMSNSGGFGSNPGAADLFFQSAPSQTGTSMVTVCLQDDGLVGPHRLYGGVDTYCAPPIEILVDGPPATQSDRYTLCPNNWLNVGAPGVLGNDINFDGKPPPIAKLMASPVHASQFGLNGDGSFSYLPEANFNHTDTFTYETQDGYGHWSAETSVGLVVAPNLPPFAAYNTTPSVVTAGAPVSFTDRSHDPEDDIVSWIYQFGDGSTSNNPNPVHRYAQAGDFEIMLEVIDKCGLTDAVKSHIHVDPAGQDTGPGGPRPVAFAGPDLSVQSGQSVELNGTASPLGGILAWSWTQVSGPTVVVVGPHEPQLKFVAPELPALASVDLVFQLQAFDGSHDSDPADVTVHVHAADPGPQNHLPQQVVAVGGMPLSLDASSSADPDNDTMTYLWRQVDGPRVGLHNVTQAVLHVEPSTLVAPSNLTFAVEMSDGHAPPATFQVQVQVVSALSHGLFTYGPGRAGTGQVSFTLLEPREGDRLAWDFGDGGKSTERNPVHDFVHSGHYTVRLLVTDANGRLTWDVQRVNVYLPGSVAALSGVAANSVAPWAVFVGLALFAGAGALVLFLVSKRR
ncbi:MAG: Ig-like domain-containing protein [Thermoplasmatota archaeon]